MDDKTFRFLQLSYMHSVLTLLNTIILILLGMVPEQDKEMTKNYTDEITFNSLQIRNSIYNYMDEEYKIDDST